MAAGNARFTIGTIAVVEHGVKHRGRYVLVLKQTSRTFHYHHVEIVKTSVPISNGEIKASVLGQRLIFDGANKDYCEIVNVWPGKRFKIDSHTVEASGVYPPGHNPGEEHIRCAVMVQLPSTSAANSKDLIIKVP